ncbi:diaminobutyrate acetyltransferase [Streptomyces sp. NPDC048659]|uniref:diaminobutyrate acetyltransferase n=1 Tax=Streptomyces sp. NPDC048659 TaxID=3155489 RepID=UPI0034140305
MTTAHAAPERDRTTTPDLPPGWTIDRPEVADGARLWRLARDSRTLDVNSSYSYLLWCRDFAETSAVARDADGAPVGFVTGYLRPDAPGTLLVWQVAVGAPYRGLGIAGALLDRLCAHVAETHAIDAVETTITPDNPASERLFGAFARRHDARVRRTVLFPAGAFPAPGHEAEVLHRIAPLAF